MRLLVDLMEYCVKNLPRVNYLLAPYIVREGGATLVQEIGFGLGSAFALIDSALERGLDIDSFAPRISFDFALHMNFFDEFLDLANGLVREGRLAPDWQAKETPVLRQLESYLPYEELFQYTVNAYLGLALYKPYNFGQLFNCGASNKIFEYLALGVPVVTNDSHTLGKFLIHHLPTLLTRIQ
jgi:hypothetical protein